MFNLKTINKSLTLFIGSQGVTCKKGLGNIVKNNAVTNEKKELAVDTLIEVVKFNFETNKVRIKCIKDINTFMVEVNYDYLLNNCVFEHKELTQPIEAVFAKYYLQNVITKETVLFILMTVLIFLCGLILGRII